MRPWSNKQKLVLGGGNLGRRVDGQADVSVFKLSNVPRLRDHGNFTAICHLPPTASSAKP